MQIENNFPLKQYNTFGVEAFARSFALIKNSDELKELYNSGFFEDEKIFILGGGSNILFRKDFDGLIIKLDNKEIIVAENNEETVDVSADAGVEWHTFLTWCLEHKFYGLENLALIPGTIGAAPVQNIGAYGIEQADFFQSLEAFDTKTGENLVFNSEDCCFDYRYSIFKNELRNRYIVTNVTYRLNLLPIINLSYKELFGELNKLNLEQIMPENVFNAVIELRQRKLPDPAILGNAGSFFKNPVIENNKYHELKQKYSHLKSFNNDDGMVKIPAAQLIELCGWKGKRLGDAGVSENHALILVNYGNATGEEIIELSEKISDSVFDKFGIKLEKEVQVVE